MESTPSSTEPTNGSLTEKLILTTNQSSIQDFEEESPVERQCCRDPFFAFLFLGHVAAVVTLGIVWGIPLFSHTASSQGGILPPTDDGSNADFTSLLDITLVASLGGLVMAAIMLAVLTRFTTTLIQMTVLFTSLSMIFFMVMCASQGSVAGASSAFSLFALGCCYAFVVWPRIPFASANLKTGLTAIHANIGVSVIPLLLSLVSLAYLFVWLLAWFGTYTKINRPDISVGILLPFLLSFFWFQQVILNVVHVTVAGVVGTWWFAPEDASSACSRAIRDSFFRASTSSFGSICFGSLMVGLVQMLRMLVYMVGGNTRSEGSVLSCIFGSLLQFVDTLMEYFNKWAFVNVGIYGYPYMIASKKVWGLFRHRGWSRIISDRLVTNLLSWVALAIGGLNGLVCIAISKLVPSIVSGIPPDSQILHAFLGGFLFGCVYSGALVRLIGSSVDTVIVCFAEAPSEFRANHPELSQEMEEAWHSVYPSEYPAVTIERVEIDNSII